ncbi:MAG: GNAT family N-acyltransferase [Bryobacteraceae bacterium]|jgi:putative hemolysin
MRTETGNELPSFSGLFQEPLRRLLDPVEPAIERLFAMDRLRQTLETARGMANGGDAVERLLEALGIAWEASPAELERIPRSGPLLVVANHPFGLLEGAILANALPAVRPDVRILTNSLLAGVAELRQWCIFVNPFGAKQAVGENARALLEAVAWLRSGGALVVFPAGEVAHFDWKSGTLADPDWNPAVARIAQRTNSASVPIFFEGANSVGFQLAGVLHAGLRTASLPRELLNKRGRRIRMRIGRPVTPATLQSFESAREAIEYLRCRTFLLDDTAAAAGPELRLPLRLLPARRQTPVAAARATDHLAAEIAALPPRSRLCDNGEFAVYLANESAFPGVVAEVGRLRELAFRQVGEGTGRAIDLDRFDHHYEHLVLWHEGDSQVAGAYRLGPTPDILPAHGTRGLYTSTLFRFRKDLFERIGPAIELGRSFVRPEYQRQIAPLLLLWKGIARYVATRPECAVLFGGVSISNQYHAVSRHLMVRFLEAHRAGELAGLVTPRSPYKSSQRQFRRTGMVSHVPANIEQLSGLVADLERDGKGVPILLRQYLKTGGKLLAFNVDRGFSHVLDALIMVDLRSAPTAILERYFGKPEAAAFVQWHRERAGGDQNGARTRM